MRQQDLRIRAHVYLARRKHFIAYRTRAEIEREKEAESQTLEILTRTQKSN